MKLADGQRGLQKGSQQQDAQSKQAKDCLGIMGKRQGSVWLHSLEGSWEEMSTARSLVTTNRKHKSRVKSQSRFGQTSAQEKRKPEVWCTPQATLTGPCKTTSPPAAFALPLSLRLPHHCTFSQQVVPIGVLG